MSKSIDWSVGSRMRDRFVGRCMDAAINHDYPAVDCKSSCSCLRQHACSLGVHFPSFSLCLFLLIWNDDTGAEMWVDLETIIRYHEPSELDMIDYYPFFNKVSRQSYPTYPPLHHANDFLLFSPHVVGPKRHPYQARSNCSLGFRSSS